MEKIAFLLDPDPGHIFPILATAQSLVQSGQEIHLLGISDIQQFVNEPALIFHPVFEDVYPKGFILEYRRMQSENSTHFLKDNTIPRPHLESIINGQLDRLFVDLDLDLLIVTYSLAAEALLFRIKYSHIRLVFFTTWLRYENLTPVNQAFSTIINLPEVMREKVFCFAGSTDIEKISKVLSGIPEIIPCPSEFDFPNKKYHNTVYHVGTSVQKCGVKSKFVDAIGIPDTKQIVYMSLGSQTPLFKEKAEQAFNAVYRLFVESSDMNSFLILSIGNEYINQNLKSVPNKIEVVRWAPQVEILSQASLMITHGGLGTIKECISFEVPMIVIPMIYDQFENAERVVHFNLGLKMNADDISVRNFYNNIKSSLLNESFRNGLAKMNAVFKRYDNELVSVINRLETNNMN